MSKPITLRRAAAMRELADLGCWQAKAARILGISQANAARIAAVHRVQFPSEPQFKTKLCREIRAGYENGLSPTQIAAAVGRPVKYVMVRASQMGITAHTVRDPAKFRRGFFVPAEKMQEYKELRRLGLNFQECGYELGIIARPTAPLFTASPFHGAHQ